LFCLNHSVAEPHNFTPKSFNSFDVVSYCLECVFIFQNPGNVEKLTLPTSSAIVSAFPSNKPQVRPISPKQTTV
jgi:hypothetical protein